jgi:hypothetical protein
VDQLTDADGRELLIRRLHDMADWLEANPGVTVSPYAEVTISHFAADMDDARAIREAAPGGWRKQTSPTDNYISYEHGDHDPASNRWRVAYCVHVAKSSATCERVQVGTRHVEEHDEPVFEWKCDA